MEIRKIEIILRAIELKSLSKAAAEFMYSTAALSQMADSLENEIGTKIIRRKHTGIEIEKGKEDIVKALEQIVRTKNSILKLANEKNKQNTVTIATYASISKNILPKAIKEFKSLHPSIDVNIIIVDKLGDIYKKNIADLFFGQKFENKDYIWEEVLTDPYVAVLPKSLNYEKDSITREELLDNTFIMTKDSIVANYVKSVFENKMISNTSNDDGSIIELIKEGICVSILPELTINHNKDVQTAVLVPPVARTLGFAYSKIESEKKIYLKTFIDFLREYISDNFKQ